MVLEITSMLFFTIGVCPSCFYMPFFLKDGMLTSDLTYQVFFTYK
jgi:hypothetical protein